MLRRWLDRLYLAAGGMGAACVALIGALMIGQSVAREFGVLETTLGMAVRGQTW